MQEEKITWNNVKTLPSKSAWYLITYAENYVGEAYYNKQQKKWLGREVDYEFTTVIAWAEMPKPYKEIE